MSKTLTLIVLLYGVLPRASAQEQVPEKIATPAYWTAVGAASGFAIADATTTVTLIHPNGVCWYEASNPALYGKYPTPARTFAVMGAITAGAALTSYELKKYLPARFHGLWVAPLAYVANGNAQGFIHNMERCR